MAPKGVPRDAEELEFEKSEKGLGEASFACVCFYFFLFCGVFVAGDFL